MNLLGGCFHSGGPRGRLERLFDHLEATYGATPRIEADGRLATLVGLEGPGRAYGCATQDGVTLALVGHIHRPLRDWEHGSPLDNPNRTAAFMLGRYRKRGLHFLDDVLGHFNIAVSDGDRILLGSDPYDHRKFYYTEDGPVTFSTNMLSVAASLGSDLEIDRSFENFLLQHGFWPFGRTPYKGVVRVPARTILELRRDGTQRHPISCEDPWAERYADVDLSSATEAEVIQLLREAFMRALEDQLASDRKAAVLLGGFDSALVASGLKELGKEVETYSFFYDNPKYDQPHTDTVSRFLGSKHHWVAIDEAVMTDGLRRYAEFCNEPTCWPNYVIGTIALAGAMREHGFDYCYSGDGCDATFFGYPLTYQRLRAVRKISSLPAGLRRPFVSVLEHPLADRFLGRPVHVGLGLLRGLELDEVTRQFLSLCILDESALPHLRRGDQPTQAMEHATILRTLAAPHAAEDPVRLAYMGKALISPTKAKINGSTDRYGISVFAPFTHLGMKHVAKRIPATLIRPEEGGKKVEAIGKYILVRMAEDYKMLPEEVIHQKKVGAVDAPTDDWYAGPLRDLMLESLGNLPFDSDPGYLERLLQPRFAEQMYAKALARYTNNITTVTLAPSLLATYGAFTSVGHQPRA